MGGTVDLSDGGATVPAMQSNEHQRRRGALRDSLVTSHSAWAEASESGSRIRKAWLVDVADQLVIAAGDDTVLFHETLGGVEAGAELTVVAFSATRRIELCTTIAQSTAGSDVRTIIKGRHGLALAELLQLVSHGDTTWPRSLTVRLRYADGDDYTLGDWKGGTDSDWAAPEKLAEFYPALLADLDR